MLSMRMSNRARSCTAHPSQPLLPSFSSVFCFPLPGSGFSNNKRSSRSSPSPPCPADSCQGPLRGTQTPTALRQRVLPLKIGQEEEEAGRELTREATRGRRSGAGSVVWEEAPARELTVRKRRKENHRMKEKCQFLLGLLRPSCLKCTDFFQPSPASSR